MRHDRSSRLRRTNEKQNKKQAIIFGIAIIAVLFVLVQFGPLLINLFGNLVYTIRGGDNSNPTQITGKEILQPPELFGLAEATQSSRFSFSGTAPDNKGTVEIYLNDVLEDEVSVDNTTFGVILSLRKGKNTIKARYLVEDKTSPFTQDYYVNYTTDKPKLEVTFPSDNATFTKADKSITVKGNTDPENIITVNGFRAIVDSSGVFSYLLQLNDGDNQIQIQATNQAGITNDQSLKVTYQP